MKHLRRVIWQGFRGAIVEFYIPTPDDWMAYVVLAAWVLLSSFAAWVWNRDIPPAIPRPPEPVDDAGKSLVSKIIRGTLSDAERSLWKAHIEETKRIDAINQAQLNMRNDRTKVVWKVSTAILGVVLLLGIFGVYTPPYDRGYERGFNDALNGGRYDDGHHYPTESGSFQEEYDEGYHDGYEEGSG
jgi:hypothetical protein